MTYIDIHRRIIWLCRRCPVAVARSVSQIHNQRLLKTSLLHDLNSRNLPATRLIIYVLKLTKISTIVAFQREFHLGENCMDGGTSRRRVHRISVPSRGFQFSASLSMNLRRVKEGFLSNL